MKKVKFTVARRDRNVVMENDGLDPETKSSSEYRKSVLPEEVERKLANYVKTMEEQLFGLTYILLRKMAYELAEANSVEHNFNKKDRMAGKYKTLTVLLSNINYLAIKLLDEIELLKFFLIHIIFIKLIFTAGDRLHSFIFRNFKNQQQSLMNLVASSRKIFQASYQY